jgi:hypothetical protein
MGDSRGALLPVLYVGLGGLNAFDAFTTTRGLAAGRAVEGNPIVGGFAGKPAAMWAVKGGATFASVFIAERLWRRQHRAQAIAVMLVSNGMMAAVAMRNSSVLSR